MVLKDTNRNEKVRQQLRKSLYYMLVHAKFALASGAAHKRTIEDADTSNVGCETIMK